MAIRDSWACFSLSLIYTSCVLQDTCALSKFLQTFEVLTNDPINQSLGYLNGSKIQLFNWENKILNSPIPIALKHMHEISIKGLKGLQRFFNHSFTCMVSPHLPFQALDLNIFSSVLHGG